MTTPRRYQLVVCDGPRCRLRGRPYALAEHARALLERDAALAARVDVAHYSCLSRCPAGPNLLVRELDQAPADEPGLYDLDGGAHYWAADAVVVERVLDEHCGQGQPLPGRWQKY